MNQKIKIAMLSALAIAFAVAGVARLAEKPVQATLGSIEYKYSPFHNNGFGASTDFGGTSGLVWTQPVNFGVLPANVLTFRYAITPMPSLQYPSSGQMHLQVAAYAGTISGTTTNAFITLRIPEGKVANATTVVPVKWTTDTATGDWQEAYCYIVEWQPLISCRRRGVGAANDWPLTSTFRFDFNHMLEILDPVDAH